VDLNRLLSIAWKRRWVLLTVIVFAGAASTAFALSRPKQYESTAVLALTPDLSHNQGLLSADNFNALMRTYAETAKASVTRTRAERLLGKRLPGPIDTAVEAGTGILRIGVRASDPDEAAAATNATVLAFKASIADNQLLNAAVVTPPEPATSPIAPRPPLIIGSALVVGILCGLLLVLALESARRRVSTAADVAEFTNAPVVGRLPRERSLVRKSGLTAWDLAGARSLKEEYRAMRTNLEALLGTDHRCLQVTSPQAGAGKSIVVASLGVAFAQVGVQTVIVDADLRRPAQHRLFGLENRSGLSSLLASSQRLTLTQTRQERLWVMTSGPLLDDPTELLHIRFGAMVEQLRELDALILIDTPPILAVSDARLVAPAVDGVLMVVDAGKQKPAALASALEKLELVNGRLLGVILNGTDSDAAVNRYDAGSDAAGDAATWLPLPSDAAGPQPSRRAPESRPGDRPIR
jgi:capsular exopolysaccharide synthesis family protein